MSEPQMVSFRPVPILAGRGGDGQPPPRANYPPTQATNASTPAASSGIVPGIETTYRRTSHVTFGPCRAWQFRQRRYRAHAAISPCHFEVVPEYQILMTG